MGKLTELFAVWAVKCMAVLMVWMTYGICKWVLHFFDIGGNDSIVLSGLACLLFVYLGHMQDIVENKNKVPRDD
jgi:hypothetical protein